MSRRLITIMIITYLLIPSRLLGEEQTIREKRYLIEPPYCAIYKTKEEIAWDLLMYGLNNIPSLKFRIKYYEDLLEAYRRALNVVRDSKEPVPPAPEKEK